MRRLRVWGVWSAMTLATVLFSCMQLFSRDYARRINEPTTAHWAGLLVGYAMVKSMMAPILCAVLASRQVDIEHQCNGWQRAALAGLRPGRLCTAKLVVLAPLVVLGILIESFAMVGGSRAAGAITPLPCAPWAWYICASGLVTLVLLAGHLWLAALIDSQLVVLGVGILGGFLGMFSMLMPPVVAAFLPWGQYASALPFTMVGRTGMATFAPLPIPWPTTGAFLLAGVALAYVALRRLNRMEV